uniref:F-box domain-containing protein n=1 Tax=Pithovirus LCPAC401 TaxID=2506595 RepID=A0A481ZBL1_9VIRU|nr:MAG: uncharacterized protein LCPAC401_01070 [Pithovirus LCPAC401]
MNTDRSVEELLELLDIQNISQLGSDVIREFFDDISYKEVMKLCRVSKQFNIACNRESMWKQKIKNDYGITKLYGPTWKETARLLFESNMINLNANWVNGKTYKELFEEGLKSKSNNYFRDLYNDYDLLPIVFPEYVHDIETAKDYLVNDPETVLEFANVGHAEESDKMWAFSQFNQWNNYILDDEKMLKSQIITMTREFSVVAHAVAEIRGTYLDNNFGLAQMAEKSNFTDDETGERSIESTPKQDKMNIRLSNFIDPMLYVITYCLMSRKNLSLIATW